jgi:hypothetical protein
MAGELPQQALGPAQPAQPQGEVTQLVTGAHDNMVELLGALQESGQVSPQDVKRLAGLIQDYRSFVSESLGGQKPQQQEAPPTGNVPVQAGTENAVPV